MEKKKIGSFLINAGNTARGIIDKSKEAVVQTIDQNDDGKFDIITANPPYIPTKDIETLDKKVKDFEPTLALDGGEDGLDLYKRIADTLDTCLNDNGTLLLEFGIGQEGAMKEIFAPYNVEIIPDFEGVDRIAVVTKQNQ